MNVNFIESELSKLVAISGSAQAQIDQINEQLDKKEQFETIKLQVDAAIEPLQNMVDDFKEAEQAAKIAEAKKAEADRKKAEAEELASANEAQSG